MKVLGAFNTKALMKGGAKSPDGKSYLPDVLKEQIPAILKAMNESVARQTKKIFIKTKVEFLYDNLVEEGMPNAETSLNFDISGYYKEGGYLADDSDILDEINFRTLKSDVNKVLKNRVQVDKIYESRILGNIIEFEILKPIKG